MTASRILVRSDEKNRATLDPSPDAGWRLLGGIGLVFASVALADLLLVWYPLQFGDGAWEFGTVTTLLDSLPLFTMGLGLGYGAAAARGQRRLLQILSVLFGVFGLILIGLTILYSRQISTALTAVTDPEVKTGLQKAISKTLIQGVLYPAVYLWVAYKGWKHAATA